MFDRRNTRQIGNNTRQIGNIADIKAAGGDLLLQKEYRKKS